MGLLMKVAGPEKYELTLTPKTFTVLCEKGSSKFSGLATNRLPKLYIVSVKGRPIYVGVAQQVVRSRLRYGMNATGKNGYHGYAWRHTHKKATLNVWCHVDAKNGDVITSRRSRPRSCFSFDDT
jgi:hypothetical protein